MAIIKPFKAVRPKSELAAQICELPYDVLSTEEARTLAANNPYSFLRVSKPEIEFPQTTNPYLPEVYARARENFLKMLVKGWLIQDEKPCFYIYRLIWKNHIQIGIAALASCEDYLNNVIKKHELTHPDKEEDRMRHIETLNAQTGLVFLYYKAIYSIDEFISNKIQSSPVIDFVSPDGIRHSSWTIDNEADIKFLQSEFSKISSIYIADGHHRAAAAVRVYKKRQLTENQSGIISVLFADHQVKILPYNRVILDLNGNTKAILLKRFSEVCTVEPSENSIPDKKGVVCFYIDRQWYRLEFKDEILNLNDPVDQLDVSLLQAFILKPIFGINDPRTDKRVQYVGGIRGTEELERLVKENRAKCAFSMHPTTISELMAVSDSGKIMPPKSTWFEPKLRDAMFIYLL
jgi:uncharacterized protein (DUF1015 family)